MTLEYFSKINISLGALVLVCFFLPWLKIDCGSIAITELSGYDLAMGHIVLEQDAMQQLAKNRQDFNALEKEHRARPQFYLIIIMFCACGMIGYSVRMFQALNRVGIFAVGTFSVFGILVIVFAAGKDFGVDIPSDAAHVVQISHSLAFYVTVMSFLGSVVLSVLGIRGFAETSEEMVTLDLPIVTDEQLPIAIEELPVEEKSNSFSDINDFRELQAPVPPEVKRTSVPAGSKKCTSCGAVVSMYQTKCLKCGTNIKPGK